MLRSSCVKPWVIPFKTDSIVTIIQHKCAELNEAYFDETDSKHTRDQNFVSVHNQELTPMARMKPIRGFIDDGTLETVDKSSIDGSLRYLCHELCIQSNIEMAVSVTRVDR